MPTLPKEKDGTWCCPYLRGNGCDVIASLPLREVIDAALEEGLVLVARDALCDLGSGRIIQGLPKAFISTESAFSFQLSEPVREAHALRRHLRPCPRASPLDGEVLGQPLQPSPEPSPGPSFQPGGKHHCHH